MAEEAFPLHLLVWNNQYLELDRELQKNEVSEGVYAAAGWRMRGVSLCVFLFSFLSFTDAFVRSHCIALIAALVFASAAGCGAPGSEGAHPAGAGGVSGPPGVHPGAAQALLGPHTLHHTGLDQ